MEAPAPRQCGHRGKIYRPMRCIHPHTICQTFKLPPLCFSLPTPLPGADDVAQLRTPVFIPELQETQDETRTELWEEGEFLEVRRLRMWVVDPICQSGFSQYAPVFLLSLIRLNQFHKVHKQKCWRKRVTFLSSWRRGGCWGVSVQVWSECG